MDPRRAIFKIDVNGNEMAALAGLGGCLDLPDAPDIVIELLAQSLQQGAIVHRIHSVTRNSGR